MENRTEGLPNGLHRSPVFTGIITVPAKSLVTTFFIGSLYTLTAPPAPGLMRIAHTDESTLSKFFPVVQSASNTMSSLS
jgi:hypothetical protein